MNEKSKNKREWVKTAAIIFLSVMLVLTFFSNTIMNYSLPEVATTYVQSGTITAKIRGNGEVKSGDPYQIVAKESRKVVSVAVRSGDVVQKGDVLLYLEDSDSGELKEAKKKLDEAKEKLDDAKKAYDMALLNADITTSDIEQAKNFSADHYRKQITAAQKAKAEADAAVEKLEGDKARLEQLIQDHKQQIKYDTAEAENLGAAEEKLNNAKAEKEAADKELTDANKELEEANALDDESEDKSSKVADAQNKVTAARNRVTAAENNLKAAQNAYDAYLACQQRIPSLTSSQNGYELQLYGVQKNLDAAEETAAQKKTELENIIGTINKVKSLQEMLDAISDAKKEVEECEAEVRKQEENVTGDTVNAEISGTVISVDVTAGKTFGEKETLVTLQPEGQGYYMSFSVTNEQARRLSVGDRADLVNAWRYDDVVVTLASIKPDKSNPGQNKELTFNITGNVIAGQTLSISVGQKSANYDLIVPNSAIREDSNGKFILIVESKSSPLGNRYVASRVDIEVIASDDTRSAVSGALYGYEYVITTSTKPVEAGKLVRLADN